MYHGVDTGFYVAFFAHYTAWLLLPGILGLIIFIISYFYLDIYKFLLTWYSLFIAL